MQLTRPREILAVLIPRGVSLRTPKAKSNEPSFEVPCGECRLWRIVKRVSSSERLLRAMLKDGWRPKQVQGKGVWICSTCAGALRANGRMSWAESSHGWLLDATPAKHSFAGSPRPFKGTEDLARTSSKGHPPPPATKQKVNSRLKAPSDATGLGTTQATEGRLAKKKPRVKSKKVIKKQVQRTRKRAKLIKGLRIPKGPFPFGNPKPSSPWIRSDRGGVDDVVSDTHGYGG